MKYSNLLTLSFISLAIVGCSSRSAKTEGGADSIERNIDISIKQIEQVQADLYQHAAINDAKTGISGNIYYDNQKITLNWNGDANTLLRQLASKRNFSFATTGVQLPLPVNVNVSNMSYNAIIERIQTQIGYRAGIFIDNNRRELLLRYTSPTSNPNEGQSYVVRRGNDSPIPANPTPKTAPVHITASMTHSVTMHKPKPVPVTTTSCSVICGDPQNNVSAALPTNRGGFFSSKGDTYSVLNTKCDVSGLLGKTQSGIALACHNGKWRKLN